MTVLELMIASALLILATGVFAAGLVSQQESQEFARQRNEALDDLRLAANRFAKDARDARAVVEGSTDSEVTLLSGEPDSTEQVVYRIVGDGPFNLEREEDGNTQVFVVKLTSSEVFSYSPDPADPASAGRVKMALVTRPDDRHNEVLLETETSLRNV